MNDRRQQDEWIRQFCDWLGRHNRLSALLDRVASWLVPTLPLAMSGVGPIPAGLRASGPPSAEELPIPTTLAMDDSLRGTRWSKGDASPGGKGPPAPPRPWLTHGYADPSDSPSAADIAEAKKKCNFYRLEGMHGRPCRSIPGAGGSDTHCPTGTLSGWFWKYDVPAYGTVYYVDCCGKTIVGGVWCNWSKEQNWCVTGKAANTPGLEMDPSAPGIPLYTCTLALLAKEFHYDTSSGEVTGVD
jgi:hypothetical protein